MKFIGRTLNESFGILTLSFLLLFMFSSIRVKAQDNPEKPFVELYEVHTVAISVASLESSIEWYLEILGFEVIKRRDFPNYDFYTAIMGGKGFQLELIQTKGSIPITNLLKEAKEQPTLVQGLKKIVIKVNELESLYNSLKEKEVVFVYPGIRETKDVWGKWFMIEDLDGNVIQFIDANI